MGNDFFNEQNRKILVELSNYRMPFGRFKGSFLIDLPEPYLTWFSQKGFPHGKLGELMALAYEIKINGLEHLIRKIKDENIGG